MYKILEVGETTCKVRITSNKYRWVFVSTMANIHDLNQQNVFDCSLTDPIQYKFYDHGCYYLDDENPYVSKSTGYENSVVNPPDRDCDGSYEWYDGIHLCSCSQSLINVENVLTGHTSSLSGLSSMMTKVQKDVEGLHSELENVVATLNKNEQSLRNLTDIINKLQLTLSDAVNAGKVVSDNINAVSDKLDYLQNEQITHVKILSDQNSDLSSLIQTLRIDLAESFKRVSSNVDLVLTRLAESKDVGILGDVINATATIAAVSKNLTAISNKLDKLQPASEIRL